MDLALNSDKSQYAALETIFKEDSFKDFIWIAPEEIGVSQWVRMKCVFGVPNYGRKTACPHQTPSVLSHYDARRWT